MNSGDSVRIRDLAARARHGDPSAQAALQRELEAQAIRIVRRVLRTRRCYSALDRCVLRVYEALTQGMSTSPNPQDDDELVARIAGCVGDVVAERVARERLDRRDTRLD